jgi:hypothetical protein
MLKILERPAEMAERVYYDLTRPVRRLLLTREGYSILRDRNKALTFEGGSLRLLAGPASGRSGRRASSRPLRHLLRRRRHGPNGQCRLAQRGRAVRRTGVVKPHHAIPRRWIRLFQQHPTAQPFATQRQRRQPVEGIALGVTWTTLGQNQSEHC